MTRRTRNSQEDSEMSDEPAETEVEGEETPEEAESEEEAKTETKTKQKRDPLPEGYVTPVGLTNALNKRIGEETGTIGDIRPQMMYGYLKNNNANFKEATGVKIHTDGRPILVLEQGFEWWDAKEERKSARATKAAEKASDVEATA